jgi:phosphate/sulfate permease
MEINWIVISIVSVCVIVLFFFLIKRNVKDEKGLIELEYNNEDTSVNKVETELKDVE